MAFIDLIKEKAKQDKQAIVLPETKDKRTLIAAAQVLKEGTAEIIMVGKEEKIMDGAGWLDVDLTGVKVVDPDTDPKLDEYVDVLYELRKHKGMTKEKAKEILTTDRLTYGVMMVKMKDADGMVAGACHSTADTLRPALQILKTAPGTDLVSGFFIVDVPDCEYGANGTFLFADCGLNQDLIGFGPKCLIRPKNGAKLSANKDIRSDKKAPAKKKTIRNVHKKSKK